MMIRAAQPDFGVQPAFRMSSRANPTAFPNVSTTENRRSQLRLDRLAEMASIATGAKRVLIASPTLTPLGACCAASSAPRRPRAAAMWPNSCGTTYANKRTMNKRAIERGGSSGPAAESDPDQEQDEDEVDLDRRSPETANGDRSAHRFVFYRGAIF